MDLKEGIRVRVHVNLRDKSFTVSTYVKGKGWRKATPAQRILLRDVEFKVSEAGRQRVLKQGRRNVHAYAYGTLASWVEVFPRADIPLFGSVSISYNPYKTSTFVTAEDKPVRRADEVLFSMRHGCRGWGIV